MGIAIRRKSTGEVFQQGSPEFNTLYSRLNTPQQGLGAAVAPQGAGAALPQGPAQQYQPQSSGVDPNYVNQMVSLYNALGPVNKQAAYGVLSDLISYTSPVARQQQQAEQEAAQMDAMLKQYQLEQAAMENQLTQAYGGLTPYQAYQVDSEDQEAQMEMDRRQTLSDAINYVRQDPNAFAASYQNLIADGYAEEAKQLAQAFGVPDETITQLAGSGVIPRKKVLGIF